MLEKLRIKVVYEDFLNKVKLTDEEKEILDRLIDKQKIIKISMEMGISERTIKYIKKKINKLFDNYWQIELVKLLALLN